MADQGTEKPTQQRVKRARTEGNFPSSREFLSAVHFMGFVAMAIAFSGAWMVRTVRITRTLLLRAFSIDLTSAGLISLTRDVIVPELVPLMWMGGALFLISIATQLAVT
jgi:flagellar biosynthesis protein FlhB